MQPPVIVWFRDDLRLADHPALAAAVATGAPLICLYVLDEKASARPLGAASRWWLAQSLRALDADIRKAGGALVLRKGDAARRLPRSPAAPAASAVFWNRIHAKAEAAHCGTTRKIVERPRHCHARDAGRPARRACAHPRQQRRRHAGVHAVLEARAGARRSAKAAAGAEADRGRTEACERRARELEAGANRSRTGPVACARPGSRAKPARSHG